MMWWGGAPLPTTPPMFGGLSGGGWRTKELLELSDTLLNIMGCYRIFINPRLGGLAPLGRGLEPKVDENYITPLCKVA